MKDWDLKARRNEVQRAQAAEALRDNPLIQEWKEEQKDVVSRMLLNADPGPAGEGDRIMAQARLQALNALGASLTEKIQSGLLAEKQIAADKRKREARDHLREVS